MNVRKSISSLETLISKVAVGEISRKVITGSLLDLLTSMRAVLGSVQGIQELAQSKSRLDKLIKETILEDATT